MALNVLRDNLMSPRPDWNRRGPKVPGWFRRGLRRIDPSLVLQYMPPALPWEPTKGVRQDMYPNGLWVVCRKLRRSRLLWKKWVTAFARKPTQQNLKMIKYARNLWHNNRIDEMATALDRAIREMLQEKKKERRLQLCKDIAGTCRRLSISKRSLGRCAVLVP